MQRHLNVLVGEKHWFWCAHVENRMLVCDLCVTLSLAWQTWTSAALSWLAVHPARTVSTPMARTNAEVRMHTQHMLIFVD